MSIEVKNLCHVYEAGTPSESRALEDVSFTIENGKFVGIVGHTGSGKSTLLQHLNGLLKPTSGQILIDGVDITADGTSMLDIRKKVGLVFQYPEYQLFEETIAKDVAFGPKNLGIEGEELENLVREAIEMVGLDYEDYKDKSPFEISGGQKRRVAIAGVLAMKPEILILDEPTAGLDPRAHKDVMDMIKNIHEKYHNTVIFVSHNMNDIANLSDQVLVFAKAKLLKDASPREVFAMKEWVLDKDLDLPDVTNLCEALREKGFDLSETIIDIDQAEKEIYDIFK
ncbi:MAG: energy-coupling factor transporter ATPase [Clostridia bacterium]|nr:energy-coupling factor transporter ATPase [Clostridia bacterium]